MHNSLALLKYHSGHLLLNDHDLPSLVSTLRPFNGCQEAPFAEFMHMAILQYHSLSQPLEVNRELVLCFWSICKSFRLMALSTNSPIRRNILANAEMILRMEMWYDAIEGFIVNALSGCQAHVCLSRLVHYLCYSDIDRIVLYEYAVPFVEQLADDVEFGIVEDAELVLNKLRVI